MHPATFSPTATTSTLNRRVQPVSAWTSVVVPETVVTEHTGFDWKRAFYRIGIPLSLIVAAAGYGVVARQGDEARAVQDLNGLVTARQKVLTALESLDPARRGVEAAPGYYRAEMPFKAALEEGLSPVRVREAFKAYRQVAGHSAVEIGTRRYLGHYNALLKNPSGVIRLAALPSFAQLLDMSPMAAKETARRQPRQVIETLFQRLMKLSPDHASTFFKQVVGSYQRRIHLKGVMAAIIAGMSALAPFYVLMGYAHDPEVAHG